MVETLYLDCQSITKLDLPELWQPALDLLIKIEKSLHNSNVNGSHNQAENLNDQEFYLDHLSLLKEARKLLETDRLTHLSRQSSKLNEIFVEALAQSTHLAQVILGPQGILDSAGSATLHHHFSDTHFFPNIDWKRVATYFQLSLKTINDIEVRLETRLKFARKKSLIIETLLDYFQIRKTGGTAQKECVLKAFQRLIPDIPLEVGDVELITSGTLWSFCIPFAEGGLIGAKNPHRNPAAQAKIDHFLQGVSKFKQEQFARFPAFGCFDAEKIDPVVIDHLVKVCQEDQATLKTLLNRMISILPLQDVDKYIVHDLWGHGWQGSLVPFDQHYQMLAEYSNPLIPDPAVAPEFLDQFIVNPNQSPTLDLDKTEHWIHRFLSKRLPIALTPIFAEMLADVIEFKFLSDHPNLDAKMPSSSPYKYFPTKIDLLLQDIPLYFSQATKPLRYLVSRPKHRENLTQIFAKTLRDQHGYSEKSSFEAATSLTQEVIDIWESTEEKFYKPKIEFEKDFSGKILTNSFTKIVLNFVSIHSTVIDFNQDLHEEHPLLAIDRQSKNIHGFRDLAVLAASLYFSDNPTENIWSIDEYVALIFKPQCQLFSAMAVG